MTTLKITGMTCDSCAVHVKEALEKVSGVQSADVSYAKGSAKLNVEAGTSPAALTAAVAAQGEQHRALLKAINEAIEALVRAVGADGDAASRGQLSATILKHEHARSQKDRQWFAPFGFDSL